MPALVPPAPREVPPAPREVPPAPREAPPEAVRLSAVTSRPVESLSLLGGLEWFAASWSLINMLSCNSKTSTENLHQTTTFYSIHTLITYHGKQTNSTYWPIYANSVSIRMKIWSLWLIRLNHMIVFYNIHSYIIDTYIIIINIHVNQFNILSRKAAL